MSGAPWSVKGIDPKAREIAKDLARRSGMTLGEWLNHVIYDDNAETPADAPSARATASAVAPDRALAERMPERTVARPPSENRTPRRPADDLGQVLASLEALSDRFETAVEDQAAAAARFERAIGQLRADQSQVAQRLRAVENGASEGPAKAEALRALEGALNKVAVHMTDGEARQRAALVALRRDMGEEMQRVAGQVNQKVLEVENRSADAIAQIGAEVSRVATAVEQRLRRADDAQAEALEKLGGEIARITERLSDRIAAAERRATQSVDEIGEQMARVTDRIHQRQEPNESELLERMRLSEERTAKLLEEARQTIERRLARRADQAEAAVPPAPKPPELKPPEPTAFTSRWTPVSEPVELMVEAQPVDEPPPAKLAAPLQPHAPVIATQPASTAPDDAAAMAAVALAMAGVDDDDAAEASSLRAEPRFERPEAQPRPSAQDLIREARTAALVERTEIVRPRPEVFSPEAPPPEPAAVRSPHTERVAERAPFRAAPDVEETVVFSDLSGRRRSGQSHSMRGVLLAGGVVGALGLASAGYIAMHPDVVANLRHPKPIPVGPPSQTQASQPQAAVAIAPAATPAPAADLDAMFQDAAAKVDANDPSGVEPLRNAANLGYAPAQRRLGKLYEDGGAGVAKDEAEGRRWTARAAANGDSRAMHNLGLDYYQGVGGPKNPVVAAEWFRRAAQLGLRDSQYNLARFYEAGLGMPQDLAQAYRWYLIAGKAGDAEALSRAQSIKPRLTPAEAARTEAAAGAFAPDKAAPPISLAAGLRSASPQQLALAQRALAKLGYYKGAMDGAPTAELGEAVQAYQRERGLAASGQLSPELMQSFASVTQ
jgi:localization factor PodJL